MARTHVNPIHQITSFMGWLILLGLLGWGAYTGFGFYQAYHKGYLAGEKAGRAFERMANAEDLKFNAYYNALHVMEKRRMPLRHGTTWRDDLYRNAWDSGLIAVAGHAPKY